MQRRRKVLDELALCRRNIAKIQETARKTYDIITISESKKILNNSYDFKLLEQAYVKFCHENELPIPAVQNKEQDTALLSKLITVLHESDEILRQNPELKEKYLKAEISYKKGTLNSQTSETIAVQLKPNTTSVVMYFSRIHRLKPSLLQPGTIFGIIVNPMKQRTF